MGQVLHPRATTTEATHDVFYWGALALILPILGPQVTIVFHKLAARNNG